MSRSLKVLGATVGLAACFGFGFSWRDIKNGSLPERSDIARLFGAIGDVQGPSAEKIFRDEYNRILAHYEHPLKAKDLKYAGIRGLMASLGDPHTMFLEPVEADDFFSETRANFVGVGARLSQDPLGAKARRVFVEGPAYKAGMRAGDIITAVDGKPARGKRIDDIVKTIRGNEGTVVRLQVLRASRATPITLTIKRAKVTIPTVESDYFAAQKVGYISVATFSEPTASQFDEALDRLNKKSMKGMVIDMRGNPGGLVQSVREILSRFADTRVVAKMRFRDGREEVVRTYGGLTRDMNFPIAVLIDSDTASAAEIFAGAMRDYGLASLVGKTTYGKSAVQNVFPLIDGSSAKVTIAKYFLPGGADIGRKVDEDGNYESGGLKPDVKADQDELPEGYEFGNPKTDPQLVRALAILKAKA